MARLKEPSCASRSGSPRSPEAGASRGSTGRATEFDPALRPPRLAVLLTCLPLCRREGAVPENVEAIIEAELLVWARKKSGYDVEVAARKASVSPRSLEAWEQGERRPSIKSLRRLARVYKRPVAFFYLPEPPRDFPPINDYRVAWGEERKRP